MHGPRTRLPAFARRRGSSVSEQRWSIRRCSPRSGTWRIRRGEDRPSGSIASGAILGYAVAALCSRVRSPIASVWAGDWRRRPADRNLGTGGAGPNALHTEDMGFLNPIDLAPAGAGPRAPRRRPHRPVRHRAGARPRRHGDGLSRPRPASTTGLWRSRCSTTRSPPRSVPQRFLREIRVAARLQHPHILPVYDSAPASGAAVVHHALRRGRDPARRLRRDGPLPVPEAVGILDAVGRALGYAHRSGVVAPRREARERPPRPGTNVFLADFGIAKPLDAPAEPVLTVGRPARRHARRTSPPSRPPLVAAADHRADIYCLRDPGVRAALPASRRSWISRSGVAARRPRHPGARAHRPSPSRSAGRRSRPWSCVACARTRPSVGIRPSRWATRCRAVALGGAGACSAGRRRGPARARPRRRSPARPGARPTKPSAAPMPPATWRPRTWSVWAEAAWWLSEGPACVRARERAYRGYLHRGDAPPRGLRMALQLVEDHTHRLARSVAHGWLRRAERHLAELPESLGAWLARPAAVPDRAWQSMASPKPPLPTRTGLRDRATGGRPRAGDAGTAGSRARAGGAGAAAGGDGAHRRGDDRGDRRRADPAHHRPRLLQHDEHLRAPGQISAGRWSGHEAADAWLEPHPDSGYPGICRVHRAGMLRKRGALAEAEREARRAAEELADFLIDAPGEAHYELGEIRLRAGAICPGRGAHASPRRRCAGGTPSLVWRSSGWRRGGPIPAGRWSSVPWPSRRSASWTARGCCPAMVEISRRLR